MCACGVVVLMRAMFEMNKMKNENSSKAMYPSPKIIPSGKRMISNRARTVLFMGKLL